jgi:hypothetical protein
MTEGYPSIQDYGGTATVDRKRLTADVPRRFRGEEHDRPLDIVVAASAAQRRDLQTACSPASSLLSLIVFTSPMDDPPPARRAYRPTTCLASRRRGARVKDCQGARPCSARTPNPLAYRSAIWRPRSSSNSPAVPRPRSRDLVIFWSAAGDLKSTPKVACVD